MIEEMKYETFKEFIERAYELRELYNIREDTPSFLMKTYRDYIYSHKYPRLTEVINNICWDWLLSNCYEEVEINSLYCIYGQVKGDI